MPLATNFRSALLLKGPDPLAGLILLIQAVVFIPTTGFEPDLAFAKPKHIVFVMREEVVTGKLPVGIIADRSNQDDIRHGKEQAHCGQCEARPDDEPFHDKVAISETDSVTTSHPPTGLACCRAEWRDWRLGQSRRAPSEARAGVA